jgi:polyferredoxin
MDERLVYQLAADALLILHAAIVAFVVFGLLLTVVGMLRRWQWTRNRWFRGLHLFAIGIVAAQAWLGVVCPLTTWEMALRERAGDVVYSGSFIEYWLHRLIFFRADPWVFTLAYTTFGLAVAATWYYYPPRKKAS